MEKTYNPKQFEQSTYQNWTEKKYFSATVNSSKKPFTIMMPPPNITGQLHIGHALDLSIQDAIIRYKRMQGFEALFMPGTDHASIATEVKIVEKLQEEGITKEDLGREEFLRRAFLWKDEYGGRIIEQQKRLGLSCDWDRLAFTMDEPRTKAVNEVFVNLYNQGLIYRGDRIINWCPSCHTALSDAEVEYCEKDSHLWHIKYPFEDGSGFITIATTRPETMLGDTAVAVNPKDKRYKKAVGKNLILPLTDRRIPVISDAYVQQDFGTGALKITPAHDPNDFEMGKRHNLPIIKVIDDSGVMNDQAGEFEGISAALARQKVVEKLEQLGLLLKTEDYKNSVGQCYRCDHVVEPLISKQWFVCMDILAAPAVEAVKSKEIDFIPKRFEKMFFHWMENTRDWCISRQLWWGHRIPVYYCKACNSMTASKTQLKACPGCGGEVWQDEDVLDTWFSSALWPFSTLGWPQNNKVLDYFYPTSVLVTAYDIIGFWVSRMIFSGIFHMKKIPFEKVLIHGIVRDKDGKKMSKSSGNGVDPLQVIDLYGADVLRISLINGVTMGGDMKYSADKLDGYRNFMNKVWNASRFVLLNSDNFFQVQLDSHLEQLSLADKWILGRLNQTIKTVAKSMDNFEIGLAASEIYDFFWNEFCDWYIEMSKLSLYSDDLKARNLTQNVLLYVLRQALKLAHPIVPFITAEIFNQLPNKDADDIMISDYPTHKDGLYKEEIKSMEQVMHLIKSLRAMRHEMDVPPSRRPALFILPTAGSQDLIVKANKYIQKLGASQDCTILKSKPTGNMVTLATDLGEVYIPMGELVDIAAETQRLNKELNSIDSEIARAKGKLSNSGFVSKAPPALIEGEKDKLARFSQQKEVVLQSLKRLQEL